MQIQETPKPPRRRSAPRLIAAGLLAFIVAVASSGLVALGAFHNNGADGLKEVGPIASDHPFPTWYRDTRDVRLELCLEVDRYCLLTSADVPSPDQPLSFPDNFPGEGFWFAADSIFPDDSGLDASLVLALEAAFAFEDPIPGTQVVFGRTRIRINGLQNGATYRITHPYGQHDLRADGGEINWTDDAGLDSTGVGALSSPIGPFLTAVDPAPPQGYIGDPNVEQTVAGSPYSTNYFRIEGPGINPPAAYRCRDAANNVIPSCAQYNRFALSGKIATNGGVDHVATLYERDASGNTIFNIYAKSEKNESITAKVNTQGSYTTLTRANVDSTSYFARIALDSPVTGAIPGVTVENPGDLPPVSKDGQAKDLVTISKAEYNADAGTLTIEAASSDRYNGGPTLSYEGQPLVNGSLTVSDLASPPQLVTVTSSAGGWDSEQARIVGAGYAPQPVSANPGAVQTVTSGAPVALDGTGSDGDITSWQWEQVDNGSGLVALQSANTAIATFIAPPNPGETALVLRFRLTVQGPGGPSSALVNVRVRPSAAAPVARAGADQTVLRGTTVQLNGTTSTNALTYQWTQVNPTTNNTVALSDPTSPTPTFTFPQAGAVVFDLRVTNSVGMTNTDRIRIESYVDTLTISSAQFTRGSNEWRVRGTALAVAGNKAYIYNGANCPVGGGTTNALFATVTVDNLGDWEYRGVGPVINSNNRVSVCTQGGARVTNFVVRIR